MRHYRSHRGTGKPYGCLSSHNVLQALYKAIALSCSAAQRLLPRALLKHIMSHAQYNYTRPQHHSQSVPRSVRWRAQVNDGGWRNAVDHECIRTECRGPVFKSTREARPCVYFELLSHALEGSWCVQYLFLCVQRRSCRVRRRPSLQHTVRRPCTCRHCLPRLLAVL